ncbi:MAG: adenylyl-sulfate kinase [Anaerolineae bacterium]|nr:adenylyl-sulfate kinase [Anaerolineae bacterium]MCO5188193.1 adenylyl-sulfate kinase [Anaerolineae bacterium]MCO5194371.1 adenylyl-sulfate kinase [Anaerolineae bacterium]MCO5198094.1 adenylyl-sulfate kinase [Anaerolineae bacterium]
MEQQGFVFWMTGLSGAGKTTIALAMIEKLQARGVKIERLDGDVVRESLTRDLGFTAEDRAKNIERVTFVAKLLSRNGIGCVCSFISPYQSVRDGVRANTTNFIEVFVDAPLEVVIDRDVKGLYVKAIAGEIPNFTGISDPFEAPQNPDLHIRTDLETVDESAERAIRYLEERGLIPLVIPT